MGWLKTLIKIYMDYARVQWVNFLLEVLWSVLSIATTLLLWRNVMGYVPTGWTESMLLSFALLLEIWVSIKGIVEDLGWSLAEIYIFDMAHLLSRPRIFLLSYMHEINIGEITALLLKILIFIPILLWMWKNPFGIVIGLLLMMVVTIGTEIFISSLSALLYSKGGLQGLFYNLQWRLATVPGDLFKGPLRIFVTAFVPVYVAITAPLKAVVGAVENLLIFLIIAVAWLMLGLKVMKRMMKNAQAFGG